MRKDLDVRNIVDKVVQPLNEDSKNIRALETRNNRVRTAGIADDVNKNHMTCHVTVSLEFEMKKVKKDFVHSLRKFPDSGTILDRKITVQPKGNQKLSTIRAR